MRFCWFFLALLIPLQLFAITTDVDPVCMINGCINVFTGAYTEYHQDLIVHCAEPFAICRSHLSTDLDSHGGGLWSICEDYIEVREERVKVKAGYDGWDDPIYEWVDAGAKHITWHATDRGSFYLGMEKKWSGGVNWCCKRGRISCSESTNTGSGSISGQTNVGNTTFEYSGGGNWTITLGNGEQRHYKPYSLSGPRKNSESSDRVDTFRLSEITQPNGNRIRYCDWRSYRLHCEVSSRHIYLPSRIEAYDQSGEELLGWAEFSFQEVENGAIVTVRSSDGQQLCYHYEQIGVNWNWGSDRKPKYQWRECLRLVKVNLPNGQTIEYRHSKRFNNTPPLQIDAVGFPDGRGISMRLYKGEDRASRGNPYYIWTNFHRLKDNDSRVAVADWKHADGSCQTTLCYYPAWEKHGLQWHGAFDVRTDVYDAFCNVVAYRYDRDAPPDLNGRNFATYLKTRNRCRLTDRIYYQGRGQRPEEKYCSEVYQWKEQGRMPAFLASKQIIEACSDEVIAERTFDYDNRGNILTETLHGKLTSTKCDEESHPVHRTYSEDGYNNLLSEQNGDVKVCFGYQPDSNLCTSKLVYWQGNLQERSFTRYDHRATVVEQICDNGCSEESDSLEGVSERKIVRTTPINFGIAIGLPETIEELVWDPTTQREELLKRLILQYNERNLVIRKDIYDTNNDLRYSLVYRYDEGGRVVYETDPIGQEYFYEYDANDNRTSVRTPRLDIETRFVYDLANRLIAQEKEDAQGNQLSWGYKYNKKGEKIASWGPSGNETIYNYDALSRLTSLQRADGTRVTHEYDVLGNVTAETDENGHTTHRQYNIRGQVTEIIHPDGSTQTFNYNPRGQLIREIARNGLITCYERDYQDRILTETKYSPKSEVLAISTYVYDGSRLVSATDPEGVTTHYNYDPASHLTEICTAEQRTTYEWDSLGRQIKQIEHSGLSSTIKIWEYDLLDRVIEERVEGLDGTVYTRAQFTYDGDGNQTCVTTFDANQDPTPHYTEYDLDGRPIKLIDALGHETLMHYDYLSATTGARLQITTVDPVGIRTVVTHDACGRPETIEKFDAMGTLIARQVNGYDGVGNKTLEEHTVIAAERPEHTWATAWEYDACNQLIRLEEGVGTAKHKTTCHIYNICGELVKTIRPSGTEIERYYDALGRLERLIGPDLAYTYHYDRNNRLLAVSGPAGTTTRTYDALGNILTETLANSAALSFNYDTQGRMLGIELPDGSSTDYSYNAAFIEQVHRNSENNSYDYQYGKMDPCGRLLDAELPGACGHLHYQWDPEGRCRWIKSPYYTAKVAQGGYDPVGNLLNLHTADAQGELTHHFGYDPLNHLIQEQGVAEHSYRYDSLANRLSLDESEISVDELNQLLEDERSTYRYDADGRMAQRISGKHTLYYRYDCLDRLIAIECDEIKICFTYDAFNRRLTKEILRNTGSFWQLLSHLNYLYVNQDEIGALDTAGKLVEYRALGRGYGAEIGAAVAIELDEAVYVPIHDYRGCVTALLNLDGDLIESYRYTAFGLCQIYDADGKRQSESAVGNPWRFCSKRHDDEAGLVFFGRRYYSPYSGRWISPDPKGYATGPNLYQYCRNRPLTQLDFYGLCDHCTEDRPKGYPRNDDIGMNPFQALVSAANLALDAIGTAVEFFGTHIAPEPISRTVCMATGSVLQGNGIPSWESMWPKSSHEIVQDSWKPNNNLVINVTNGVLTNLKSARETADDVARQFPDATVYCHHVASWGAAFDVGRCILEFLGVQTGDVTFKAACLTDLLARLGPTDQLVEMAHSRGAMVLSRALDLVPCEHRDYISAVTVAPALAVGRNQAARSLNFLHKRDPVALLGLLQCGWHWQDGQYSVHYVKDLKTSLVPHIFRGGEYEEEWLPWLRRAIGWLRNRDGEPD